MLLKKRMDERTQKRSLGEICWEHLLLWDVGEAMQTHVCILSGQQWDCWHGCHGLVTVNFWKRWWSRESEEQNDEVIWLWWCRKYGRVFGCKINGYNGFNFNHPVRLKIFRNEFALPKHVHTTPVIPGKWLNPWKRMLIHLKRQHNLVREWRSCYTWQYGQDQKLTIRCDTCHTKWVWRQRST